MAKDYGVAANLKSSMLVDGIIYESANCDGSDQSTRTYDCATYMKSMEAVRLLMKLKSGAKCILDCVKEVEAELLTAVKPPGVMDGREPAVDVKAYVQGNANGNIEFIKANEVVPPPKPLASAFIYAPMFVGGV